MMNVLVVLALLFLTCRNLYLEGQMIALKHTLGFRANESFKVVKHKVWWLVENDFG